MGHNKNSLIVLGGRRPDWMPPLLG
jgi:hypothetical protein